MYIYIYIYTNIYNDMYIYIYIYIYAISIIRTECPEASASPPCSSRGSRNPAYRIVVMEVFSFGWKFVPPKRAHFRKFDITFKGVHHHQTLILCVYISICAYRIRAD